MPWMFKDMNDLLENKFQGNENMKDYNSKICMNFLTMSYLSALEKLKDKICAFTARLKLMNELSHDSKHVKSQPHVCSGQMVAAQIKTLNHTNAENLKIQMKQCLNEFYSAETLMKR